MASLNLSANGPSISKSYQSVVNSSISESARGFSAFAKWAIFSVSTPLVSAFQQDAGNKESVLKVQDTGEGELADFIDEFSEGKIQFAFVKITDANTGLPKNVFIAWCGEGVPERTKGYFTSHLSTVSKFLHGYHVQITARSDADLTVDAIIQKVGDASGSKYTPRPERPTASVPKPPLSSKPVFTPLRTGGINTGTADTAQVPLRVKSNDDDDGWGSDAPPVTRTNLEKVQPAYQPTRVNIQELRSEKQAEPTVKFSSTTHQRHDVVKGGYQPIGKVDIAAIRNQAREAGNLKDDRPEPVKGAYEPVGKVDIAAIRAKAHKTNEDAVNAKESPAVPDEFSSSTTNPDFTQSSRLKSLPKPKVSNRFGGSSTFLGTKPPLPGDSASSATSPAAPIGSASRTFADQGGKTPAQLWAERKAKERGHDPTAVVASSDTGAPSVQNQLSGGEWKSSYSGKSWAPVQTTHTGRSVESSRNEAMVSVPVERPNPEPIAPQQSVSTIRDQLMQGPPKETSSFVEPTESASFPTTGFEASRATQPSETPTAQPSPPGSPAPDLTGESSPIRVAVPVSKEFADDNEGKIPSSTTEYMGTPQQGLSDDKGQTNNVRDASLVSDGATPAGGARIGELRVLVHYDYEKAEDNEIDLKEGEYVTEIEMVDKDWWFGLNARGDRGLFPSNYVEVIEDDYQSRTECDTQPATNAHATETVAVSTQASSSRDKPTAKALYDYEAAEDNELSFPEDAEITNIEFPDDDWWLGQYHGKTGLFPANYVQLVD